MVCNSSLLAPIVILRGAADQPPFADGAPNMMRLAAAAHDTSILGTFALLFDISSRSEWNQNLHNVTYENWERQARLPLRLSGCGLRNSLRTSSAAYWASWADCLKGICDRFLAIGARVSHRLNVI